MTPRAFSLRLLRCSAVAGALWLSGTASAGPPRLEQTAHSVFIDLLSLEKHVQQTHPLPAWIEAVEIAPLHGAVAVVSETVPCPRPAVRTGLLRVSAPGLRLSAPAPLLALPEESVSEPAIESPELSLEPVAEPEASATARAELPAAKPGTAVRVRLRRTAIPGNALLVRVFFHDASGCALRVTAWNEVGDCLFASQPLGEGIDLRTWESVVTPVEGVSYLEIAVPGDGANLHGLFLDPLANATTRHSLDFPGPPDFAEPFSAFGGFATADQDSFLFDRVRAVIDEGTVKLPATGAGTVAYEFSVGATPALAVLSFEVLNAAPTNPPQVAVNGYAPEAVSLLLPDLADPAYDGMVVAGQPAPFYRYRGWMRCQRLLGPGQVRTGDNRIEVISRDLGAEIAVRAVEIQLKYNTDNPTP